MERTLTATEDGVKRATKAFTTLGITQVVFAEERLGCSRTPVSNFFNQKPVDRKIFTQICKNLNLEWSEIAEMAEEGIMESIISDVTDETNSTDNQIRLAFAITGTVDQVDQAKLMAIVKVLRQLTGDDLIEIVDIREGSIKLILTGTPEALVKIQTLYRSGNLEEVEGTSVVSVDFDNLNLSGADLRGADLRGANLSGADLMGANLSEAKLIGAKLFVANLSKANLSGAKLFVANLSKANLSGANLSGADLSRANLNNANLYGAKLSRANLSEASLSGANLTEANFYGADLSVADIRSANLSNANLYGANLDGADLGRANLRGADFDGADLDGAYVRLTRFRSDPEMSQEMKRDLISRGAIFDDVQGDDSRILTPASR